MRTTSFILPRKGGGKSMYLFLKTENMAFGFT
jgi:hypothetical protein